MDQVADVDDACSNRLSACRDRRRAFRLNELDLISFWILGLEPAATIASRSKFTETLYGMCVEMTEQARGVGRVVGDQAILLIVWSAGNGRTSTN